MASTFHGRPPRTRWSRFALPVVLALAAGLACEQATSDATQAAEPTAASVQAPPPTTPSAPTPTPPRLSQFNPTGLTIELQPVLRGLRQPVFVTNAGDGSGALYVVEKSGVIRIAEGGTVRAAPFLDITSKVNSSGSEEGLLGLAFHPNYKSNGYLYVHHNDQNGDIVIERYTANSDRRAADPASAKIILPLAHPDFSNHNGGMLLFGPDGKLWIGTGDGGSGGDPRGNGQNKGRLLGKMLRIDVDGADPYGIPPDNPYVGDSSARPEVWAIGLRNPWRYSFDTATGDLYIGDVGQNNREEVDFVPAGTRGGLNFGWNLMEGTLCYPSGGANCNRQGLELPISDYPTHQDGGCAVTGGYVYRGKAFPALTGAYLYADFCNGIIWALYRGADGRWNNTRLPSSGARVTNLSSFGIDEAGEVYVTSLSAGTVYRVAAIQARTYQFSLPLAYRSGQVPPPP